MEVLAGSFERLGNRRILVGVNSSLDVDNVPFREDEVRCSREVRHITPGKEMRAI